MDRHGAMPEGEPRINAREVHVGVGVTIGARTYIGGIDGPADSVVIGDHVSIGPDSRILVASLRIGDYTRIHHHFTANGFNALTIGSCCYFSQNALLNASAGMSIGDGVQFGAYSSVYTHLSGADPLEGFQLASLRGARLEEDVFVAPQCFIGPVTMHSRSMLLACGVLTKDAPPNTIWGGNPARDLTDKLGAPFGEVSVEEKYQRLCALLQRFHARGGVEALRESNVTSGAVAAETVAPPHYRQGSLAVTLEGLPEDGEVSVFDVRDRSYSKLGTPEEVAFMRFLLPAVKFYPRDRVSNEGILGK